jgi:hypothetical protein
MTIIFELPITNVGARKDQKPLEVGKSLGWMIAV